LDFNIPKHAYKNNQTESFGVLKDTLIRRGFDSLFTTPRTAEPVANIMSVVIRFDCVLRQVYSTDAAKAGKYYTSDEFQAAADKYASDENLSKILRDLLGGKNIEWVPPCYANG
jgi:hypothetical protein